MTGRGEEEEEKRKTKRKKEKDGRAAVSRSFELLPPLEAGRPLALGRMAPAVPAVLAMQSPGF